MSKYEFLGDLSRLLSDLPQEEREQALKYYEDYFEDAGNENEQKVIQELGSPANLAQQIRGVNSDNIEYGQGSHQRSGAFPNIYANANQQSRNKNFQNNNFQNRGFQNNAYSQAGYQHTNNDKHWYNDSGKVTAVVILAILAVPVGIPVISTILGLLTAFLGVIFALFIGIMALSVGLIIGGIATIVSSFMLIGSSAGTIILVLGTGLLLTSLGVFLFYLSIMFCIKCIPVIIKAIGKVIVNCINGIKRFFEAKQA